MSAGWQREISPREAEVLAAVGERRTNAEIAGALHLSVRTVETHVSSLLRKAGVADRRALAELAARYRPSPLAVTGVPAHRTTFVGRDRERAAVLAALDGAGLVTLFGPGGVGKTRLAAAVAAGAAPDFAAGGAWVDLVPVRAGFAVPAVAGALGVAELPSRSLEQAVVARLRSGPSLLVLDNCEHVVDEVAAFAGRVMAACPEAAILATSRERLGVPGERIVPVPPLADEAETLFLDRARAAAPGFAAAPGVLAALCARLDGLPLAIELAAARAASLGADGLVAALDDRLRLLTRRRGADTRHGSLRAVLDWSHDLLDTEERALFRRLAVFAGGFDLAAVAATNPGRPPGELADLLGRLVDKSLLVHGTRTGGGSRWRLLETVRAFAADQLGDAERADVVRLHLRWAVATAADLEGRLERTPPGEFDRAAFDEIADDLRAALAAAPTGADAHQLARSLGHLAFARRFYEEAREHYRTAAARAGDAAVAARDLRGAADTALAIADGPTAYALLLEVADRAGEAGDGDLRAAALASAVIVSVRYAAGDLLRLPAGTLAALLDEAVAAGPADPHAVALLDTARVWLGNRGGRPDLRLAEAAVAAARATGDAVLAMGALDALGAAIIVAGHARRAHQLAVERLAMLDALPWHQPYAAAEIVDAFHAASAAAVAAGELPATLDVARRAEVEDPIGDHPYLAAPKMVRVLTLTGRFAEALRYAGTMWERWREDGSPPREWMSTAVAIAAMAAALRDGDGHGGYERWRARALEAAGGVADPADSADLAAAMAFVDARVALHLGGDGGGDGGAELVARATGSFTEPWWYGNYAVAAGAELAVAAGLPDAADRLAAAMPSAAENAWAAACLARASGRLRADRGALAEAVAGWERIGARFERACTLLLLPERAEEGRAELDLLGATLPATLPAIWP
ncbi:MAG: ATP-binding protein [Mycobacteriales bacterium]